MTYGHQHSADGGLDARMSESFVQERYRYSNALWSADPNPHLVTESADLAPGSSLDAGCGEGADAIWLAAPGMAGHRR